MHDYMYHSWAWMYVHTYLSSVYVCRDCVYVCTYTYDIYVPLDLLVCVHPTYVNAYRYHFGFLAHMDTH